MRSGWLTGFCLMGVALVGTGASLDGIEQARRWQYQADLALAVGQREVAYSYYQRIAEVFPDTEHGRLAARRARALRRGLLWPDRSPTSEDPGSWFAEWVDFLVWP